MSEARAAGEALGLPAGVLAQVWRDGARQARLAGLIGSRTVEVAVLDEAAARAVGRLCAQAGASDVVDASVVLTARARRPGDHRGPGDLAAIDPALELLVL